MGDLERILIADDEETFLYATADLLRREGYRCDCAPDAWKAAEMLRATEYDLLISDIMMPGNPQMEFIRDRPNLLEGMPVILVTGYPAVDTAVESIKLKVAAYLVKPVDFNELLVQIRLLMKNSRAYHSVRKTQQRVQGLRKELTDIENALADSERARDVSVCMDTFTELTFQNIVGSLLDLKYLTGILADSHAEVEPCHMLECPRLAVLTDSLLEAISVLEKTKSAFKSKDLGELRKKLGGVINSGENMFLK